MENLGDILWRISAGSTVKTTNGIGAVPAPEPERGDDCPHCNGSGWVTQRVHVGHPNFGQATPCQCRETEQSLPSRLEALRRYSNLGALSRLTFGATRPDGPMTDVAARHMFAEALTRAAEYAENPEGWLVLTGPSGSGKTHLAAAIANRCIERQQTVFFIMVADLLDHLRAAYSPSSEIAYDDLFEQVRTVPILVLDDLGAHSSTPWAQEKLFQIIYHRYNNSLPTVVTIRGPMTRLDEWIRTRIQAEGRSSVLQLGHFQNRLLAGIGEIYPAMLQRMTFDFFHSEGGRGTTREEQAELEKAKEDAVYFCDYTDDKWLLITGNHGTGKTHLAVAIAGEQKRRGEEVFFAFVPSFLDHLRKTYSPNSAIAFDELFEQVANTPLLVLDDLGAENSTPWAEEKLYQIIVHRHESQLPTIVTSAATLSDFGNFQAGNRFSVGRR